MHLPRPGQLFQRKYEIQAALGQGGTATVYRATDVEIRREVAIKILAPSDDGYDEGLRARFMVEARVLAGLSDSHTIRLFEFGESEEGLLYMVFQYVAGVDLATVLADRGALPPPTAVHVAVQMLQALSEAHHAGVLHRDVKPANILIHAYMGDEFAAKILDFGIAKVDATAGGVALTKTGAVVGTLRYMSPEQVFGEPLTPASDVYSLGLVLYEMLVGRPTMEGEQRDIIKKHVGDEPNHMPASVGWPSLRGAVEKMMARRLADRYDSALAAIDGLQRALEEGAQPVPPGSEPHYPPTPAPTPAPTPEPAPTPVEPPLDGESAGPKPRNAWTTMLALAGGVGVGVILAILASVLDPNDRGESRAPPAQLPSALLKVQPQAPPDAVRPDLGSPDAATADDLTADARRDGCGEAYAWQWERIMPIGGGRDARVYLPTEYDPEFRHPVVLAFQGPYISNGQFIVQTGFAERLKTTKVVVLGVRPADLLQPWRSRIDDLAAVRRTLDEASRRFCLDLSHIYAIGHDVGAQMAHNLACEMQLSGLAISGFAETPLREYCDPKPTATILLRGKDDVFVPAGGGTGCSGDRYISADEQDEAWRRRNHCVDGSRAKRRADARCREYNCASGAFSACTAPGGHYLQTASWAIMWPNCPVTVMDGSVFDVVWPFFLEHGQPLSVDEIPP